MRRVKALFVAALVVGSVVAVATPAAGHDTAFAVDVDVEPTQPAAGENTTVAVTLESLLEDGESTRVTEVTLYNGTGDDAEQLDSVDANAWVGGGEDEQWEVFAELDETGDRDLRVELDLISRDGDRTVLTREVPVTVVDPHPSLAVASEEVGPSGTTDVTLTVANGANVNATGVEVALSSPDATFSEPRQVVSSLGPGESAELRTSAADVSPGPVDIRAEVSYTTGDGEHRSYERTLTTTVESVDNPARVTLTGVRVEQQGQTLSISGSASNPGATNASGAEIRAVSGEHVAPGNSRASFFVGDVEASDYTSFEVNSRLTSDVNETIEIPLEIEYAVDGERVTTERTITYTPVTTIEAEHQQQGSLPLVPIGVVIAIALGIVGWRRYR